MQKRTLTCNECEMVGSLSPYLTDAYALSEHLVHWHDYDYDQAEMAAEAWDEEQYISWAEENDPSALDVFDPKRDAWSFND